MSLKTQGVKAPLTKGTQELLKFSIFSSTSVSCKRNQNSYMSYAGPGLLHQPFVGNLMFNSYYHKATAEPHQELPVTRSTRSFSFTFSFHNFIPCRHYTYVFQTRHMFSIQMCSASSFQSEQWSTWLGTYIRSSFKI